MSRPIFRFGDFLLDPSARGPRLSGDRVALLPKSLECLIYLVGQRVRAVGRDELISAVWGWVDVSDASLAQTLLRAPRGRRQRQRTVQHPYRAALRLPVGRPYPIAGNRRHARRGQPANHWRNRGSAVAAPVLAMAGGAGVCRSAGNGPGHPGWVGAQASPKRHRYSRTCWWYRRLP
ncbi:winged helix-turn-helix domain-containing protein [Tahibacter aquaticus]|uniref:winged helix-turn-helix domain-containing protein n=1 Tax=Tahibacter aquaticus TaxID=520092 RepID=UPI001061951F|nr:hypothetical protein [Tahibacter aquaticus]